MRLKCIRDDSANFSDKYRAAFVPKSETLVSFPVALNKEYTAAAMGIFMGCTVYLIHTEKGDRPDFLPAPLFGLIDGRISLQWKLWVTNDFDPYKTECVFGYHEIADSAHHLDDLLNGEPDAVQIYLKRLHDIDDELHSPAN
jgi:hypothetical protein